MKIYYQLGIVIVALLSLSTKLLGQSQVLKFDSSHPESYVDCGSLDEYSLDEFTIETWLYVDNWSGNYIIANESWNDASGSAGFALRFGSNGQLEMNVGTGTWEAVKSPENSIKLKQWHHLSTSLDSGNKLRLYIDGEQVQEGTLTKPMLNSETRLYLGEGSMWQDRKLDGKLMDVRIWNVVKTVDEINRYKDIQLNGDENGLVANWLLNEGKGDTLTDLTGNHNLIRGAGTSWASKNKIQIHGSLKILTQGKDSVLVSISNEVVDNWELLQQTSLGKVNFPKIDDYSAYVVLEAQTNIYENDTISIVASTSDGSQIIAKVAVDLYNNEYQYYGEKLLDQVHDEFYNKSNGLYAESINAESQFIQPTSFVWPASHMLRALKNAYKLNPDKYESLLFNYLRALDQYKTTKAGRTGFAVLPGDQGIRFYDDNGQLVIPFSDIYGMTEDSSTLENLKIAYEFNNGIRDSQYGIPQHEDQLGFGMFFSMSVNYTSYAAAKLYQITNDTRYLNEALAYYEKENNYSIKIKDEGTNLFNQTSYYQNGSWSLSGVVNGENQWGGGYRAYQTTVVVQNAVLLYQITKEQKYLDDAYEMMTSCIDMWYKQGQGLSEISFWGGNDMIDALLDIYREMNDQGFLSIAKDIMNFLSRNNRDKRGYYAGSYDDSSGKWNLYRTSLNPSEINMMGQAAAASSFLNVALNSGDIQTGIIEPEGGENESKIIVYPNHFHNNEEINIKIPGSAGGTCNICLYNQSGQLVQSFGPMFITGNNHVIVRPAVKSPGLYFIHLRKENNLYQAKVLIY